MTENLENENIQGQETETEETVTMTKEELNALLQKEGDRRVSSALKKQEQKMKSISMNWNSVKGLLKRKKGS